MELSQAAAHLRRMRKLTRSMRQPTRQHLAWVSRGSAKTDEKMLQKLSDSIHGRLGFGSSRFESFHLSLGGSKFLPQKNQGLFWDSH